MNLKNYYILLFVLCIACNTKNANDCLQVEGSIIETTFEVDVFTKLRIEGEVTLTIKQGETQVVMIQTGENLLSDISVGLDGETLVIKDGNKCNFFRDYGITKAFVTSPNLTELRNSSSFDIIGDGVLSYPELRLVSNTTGGIEDVTKGGDFMLQIDCEEFRVSANGQSVFYISGMTDKANLIFGDEAPRFEGAELMIGELTVRQRSANKMIVNPQEQITGEIRGTGDIIAVHRPAIVEVETFFTGQLIFQD